MKRATLFLSLLLLVAFAPAGAQQPPAPEPAPAQAEAPPVPPVPPIPEPPAPPEPPKVFRPNRGGDAVAFGEPITVGKGELRTGDVVAFGGPVEVKGEVTGDVVGFGGPVTLSGRAQGDVVAIGGPITVSGTVMGDVVAIGGPVDLEGAAHVHGDVVSLGGRLRKSEEAVVDGQLVQGFPGGKIFPFAFGGLGAGWVFLLGLAATLIGLVFVILFAGLAPERTERMADYLRSGWYIALPVGFGAWVVMLLACFVLVVTCIGIPVAILIVAAYKILKFFGLAAFFLLIGRQIAFRRRSEPPYMPAVLIGWLPFAILGFIPFCIGWLLWFVLGWIGIGALVMTRFGTRQRAAGTQPATAAPPSPPLQP